MNDKTCYSQSEFSRTTETESEGRSAVLSESQISRAKTRTRYATKEIHHEHDDCIRMAYEWLDAQPKTKGATRHARAIKHMIEKWAGRYVSQSDVEVAAELHPEIRGTYPFYNIGSKLVLPSEARLANIGEAKSQSTTYSLSARTKKEIYGNRTE